MILHSTEFGPVAVTQRGFFMSYKIKKRAQGYIVVNSETGEQMSKRPITRSRAKEQMAALYANEPDAKKKEDYSQYGMVSFKIHPRHWEAILGPYLGEKEAPDSLHITLAYLGPIAEQSQTSASALQALQSFTQWSGPIKGEVSGIGRFTNTHRDGFDAVYASFDAPKIASFRSRLVDALQTYGITVFDNHGFTPHITVGYVASDAPTPAYRPEVTEMWFDEIVLDWGTEIYRVPLSLDEIGGFGETVNYLNYALGNILIERPEEVAAMDTKEKADAPEYRSTNGSRNCADCRFFQAFGDDKIASWCSKFDFHSDPAYTCSDYEPKGNMMKDKTKETKMRSEADGKHPASHYLVVEDSDKVTSWRLRVYNPDGTLNHRLMGGAWGALTSNHRGNKYGGPDKAAALTKLRGLYKKEDMAMPEKSKEWIDRFKDAFSTGILGRERTLRPVDYLGMLQEYDGGEELFQKVKETESTEMVIFKDWQGQSRWILLSSNAFLDREGDLISRKALSDDVARADKTGVYGPLLWWHLPYAKLGDTDFNMMAGDVLVESGTFISEAVAESMKEYGEELGASLGFFHLKSEPDKNGMLNHIYRFERSLLPTNRAANQFTKLLVAQHKESEMTTAKDKLAALGKMVGDSAVLSSILEAAGKVTEKAKALGLTEEDIVSRVKELDLDNLILSEIMGTTQKAAGEMDDDDDEEDEYGEKAKKKELAMAKAMGEVMKKSLTDSLTPVTKAINALRVDVDAIKAGQTPEKTKEVSAQLQRLADLEKAQKSVGGKFDSVESLLKEILTDVPGAVASQLKEHSVDGKPGDLTDVQIAKLKEDGKLPPIQPTQKEIDTNPNATFDNFLSKLEIVGEPNGNAS